MLMRNHCTTELEVRQVEHFEITPDTNTSSLISKSKNLIIIRRIHVGYMEFVLHVFDLLIKISYYKFLIGPVAQLDKARRYGR